MHDTIGSRPAAEKQEEPPKESRSFLRIQGARVYVADLLTEEGYTHRAVLARFYGAREAVKAVASGLWLRKDVFFARDDEVDGKILEKLERDSYVEGMEGMARLGLEQDIRYERVHHTIRTGVSMMSLLHPGASGRVTETGEFFVIVPAGEDPTKLFIRAANRATTVPLPEDIAPDLWKYMEGRKDITRLKGIGGFEGYRVRATAEIKDDVARIIRARTKVVSIGAAQRRTARSGQRPSEQERPIRKAA